MLCLFPRPVAMFLCCCLLFATFHFVLFTLLIFAFYVFKDVGTLIFKKCKISRSLDWPKHYLYNMIPSFLEQSWNISVINKGSEGPYLGPFWGSSRNDPKSIAICPEVKISHLGRIRTPKNHQNTLKNQEIHKST